MVSKVGVAPDGVPVFSDAPSIQQTGHMPALDTCGGHIDPGGWYHWHATSTDIETVFAQEGVVADCALEQNSAALFGYAFDGFAVAAMALGVTPDALMRALGNPQAGRPDMVAAAKTLGITEDALRAALPPPPNR